MRICDFCAAPIESRARNAKYCSLDCQRRSNRGESPVALLPPPSAADGGDGLAEVVRRELEAAGQFDSSLGQAALILAARMGAASGAALAQLSKELRALMAAATGGAEGEVDPVDELSRRRDQKLG